MALSTKSLKSAQLGAVHRMLAFNDENAVADEEENNDSSNNLSLPPAGSAHNQWKILVYDAECRSIISPLMSVSQLRRRGVTLHLLINSEREPIPHTPVVYFCRPTKANLSYIASDCAKGLYGQAHVNFVTKLDRPLMEDFAKIVVQTNSLNKVASLHDQYLDFSCLEKHLFTLVGKPNSYATLNGPGITEAAIEQTMTDIAYGLFSVVATLGQVPIIRCPRNGAPEMVARKLQQMIAEHPTLLRRSTTGHQRPLLVLLDRHLDLLTPVQHSSSYQALLDDLLTHKANRVEFKVSPPGADAASAKKRKMIAKKYDLDPDQDPFYSEQKFQPFPEAIESNGMELQEVTTRETEIRSKAGGGGGAGGGMTATDGGAGDLALAVDSLPALLERKKQLEIHTSILQAIMTEVAARQVPEFYELENALAAGQYKNDVARAKQQVLELVTDPAKGNVEDKIRIVMVLCAAVPSLKSSDMEEVAEAMKEALETRGSAVNSDGSQRGTLDAADRATLATGMKAIAYLKQLRSMNSMLLDTTGVDPSDNMVGTESSTTNVGDSAMLSNFMKSATNQATGLFAKATEKMAMLGGKVHKGYATRVVEHLVEKRSGTEDDTYLYLDPKLRTKEVDVATLRTTPRAPIKQAIVFVIGGGCYSEYQNLQMIGGAGGGGNLDVVYGSTELMNPLQFVQQLSQLG
mmetsp:Transcript_14418/g.21154  ORF Transcript_14418/g.21154 Transcript_14418/m.21154 type:complete len:689 (-) Transcript_14418:228-2294(-)